VQLEANKKLVLKPAKKHFVSIARSGVNPKSNLGNINTNLSGYVVHAISMLVNWTYRDLYSKSGDSGLYSRRLFRDARKMTYPEQNSAY